MLRRLTLAADTHSTKARQTDPQRRRGLSESLGFATPPAKSAPPTHPASPQSVLTLMKGFIAPMFSRYAAIRIDPIATVEGYDYPDIQETARNLKTKTYLVFIDEALQVTFPDSPWFGYCVIPVAPCLRPPYEERGVRPDMCIPICPNKALPLGRDGLETQPTFPFDNCYHWSDPCCQMDVRVRASPDGFDDDTSIKLPPAQRIRMSRFIREDRARMRLLREHGVDESSPAHPSLSQETTGTLTQPGEAGPHTDERIEAISSSSLVASGCASDGPGDGASLADAQGREPPAGQDNQITRATSTSGTTFPVT
ncbi:hypothetical protein L226DRAFT_540163 [Lentinus tigrinus ALCF2SS1-7]|uniref:uncharacterized protein n=1 Tax=Lentinus tigrinus ALCF2SS1-7 TaxID=1328758 RepID=UPI0011660F7B|nr:hypothetical protein L226DRAFT_540163 [Lentinus tigrinus ALCF2SS1-7]